MRLVEPPRVVISFLNFKNHQSACIFYLYFLKTNEENIESLFDCQKIFSY
jgi:hypothetical protein